MTRQDSNKAEKRFRVWLNRYHTADLMRQAEQLAVRRDMVTLLRFVQENKVVGTQSTGNMPLKMVRAVTAEFVNPPVLDRTIGDKTYRLRSEEDVWPLYFLHILGNVGNLLTTPPGGRWQVTKNGAGLLNMDPILQASNLLTIWWYQTNWVVAYPYEGMGDGTPPRFSERTLSHLRQLTVDQPVPFDLFADKLISATGLRWSVQTEHTPMILRSSIRAMVINILQKFEAVACSYVEKPLGKSSIKELESFKITPFGHMLLEALALVID
jgi:hypothetical protein